MCGVMKPAHVFSLLEGVGVHWATVEGASTLPNIYMLLASFILTCLCAYPPPPSCMLRLAPEKLELQRPDLCLVLARILSACVVGGNQKI